MPARLRAVVVNISFARRLPSFSRLLADARTTSGAVVQGRFGDHGGGEPILREAGPCQRLRLKRFFSGWIPFEEHVRELAVLGLAGHAHDAADLAESIGQHWSINIGFVTVPDLRNPKRATPETIEYHGRDRYTVWLPKGLTWWYREYVCMHAIGHVAAGHPLRVRDPLSARTVRLSGEERKRLARRAPLTPQSDPTLFPEGFSPTSVDDLLLLYEAEADLRARYYMRTAQLGGVALEIDRLNQIK